MPPVRYALARPVLRKVMHVSVLAPQEARLLDETTRRVNTYGTHQVLYESRTVRCWPAATR
jgi:hypothetical protein